MIIPPGYGHVQHFFSGSAAPNGAAVTYGVQISRVDFLENMANDLHTAFADSFLDRLVDDIYLQETRIKAGPNATGGFATHVDPLPGSVVVEGVTPNVAILIEKRTALGGRSGRGRMYLPGATEGGFNQAGVMTTAYQTDLQGEATEFLTALDTLNLPMVLLHNASSDPTTVTSLTVDPLAATQRRRLR